jgi:CRP-like cAMP-binding protein
MKGLSNDDLDGLAAAGRVERVTRREAIALDGPMLTVVLDGYFRVFRNAAFVRDVTLGLAARGDILAPGAASGDRSAESGAEALSAAHVVFVARDAFERFAGENPAIYLKMAQSLGLRLSRIQKRLEQYSRAGVEARVAAILLELADDFGTPAPGGVRLDLPLSQEDLARLAGTTRESCSSTVAAFAREGLVRGGRLKGLLILDRRGLAAMAGDPVH